MATRTQKLEPACDDHRQREQRDDHRQTDDHRWEHDNSIQNSAYYQPIIAHTANISSTHNVYTYQDSSTAVLSLKNSDNNYEPDMCLLHNTLNNLNTTLAQHIPDYPSIHQSYEPTGLSYDPDFTFLSHILKQFNYYDPMVPDSYIDLMEQDVIKTFTRQDIIHFQEVYTWAIVSFDRDTVRPIWSWNNDKNASINANPHKKLSFMLIWNWVWPRTYPEYYNDEAIEDVINIL